MNLSRACNSGKEMDSTVWEEHKGRPVATAWMTRCRFRRVPEYKYWCHLLYSKYVLESTAGTTLQTWYRTQKVIVRSPSPDPASSVKAFRLIRRVY